MKAVLLIISTLFMNINIVNYNLPFKNDVNQRKISYVGYIQVQNEIKKIYLTFTPTRHTSGRNWYHLSWSIQNNSRRLRPMAQRTGLPSSGYIEHAQIISLNPRNRFAVNYSCDRYVKTLRGSAYFNAHDPSYR